jgi:hypothetical protein
MTDEGPYYKSNEYADLATGLQDHCTGKKDMAAAGKDINDDLGRDGLADSAFPSGKAVAKMLVIIQLSLSFEFLMIRWHSFSASMAFAAVIVR